MPGVDSNWQVALRLAVDETLLAGDMPGMLLAVARRDAGIEYLAVGADERGTAIVPDSLFAVASLTKPATALAVLRLVVDGRLDLDESLSRYLPNAAAAQADVTLRSLLCHTSGAPMEPVADIYPYTSELSWTVLAAACLATPLEVKPWTHVCYSNVGYGLAAIVVERATGLPFSEALSALVLEPLGIEGYLGVEPPREPVYVSGIKGPHVGTALEPFNSAFWRSLGMPWGGMVTTAAGSITLAQAFTPEAGFLPPELAVETTSDQTRSLSGGILGFFEWPQAPWGLGVELRGVKEPCWLPPGTSQASFGHAGSSGCLVWHDPDIDLTWAILGARRLDAWSPHLPALNAAILSTVADR